MDRLQAMQLFTRVVELGSFTRAAEQLDISRASASTLIKQLETHLGVRLLQRTTRQVSPTLDGDSYYRHCREILAQIEEAESALAQVAHRPRGRLRIDLPASLSRLVVLPALPDFQARYPDIRLEVGSGDRRVDLVGEGVDCVVRIGELKDSTLVARPLPPLEQVTCASADYVARHGRPASLEQLAGHRCVAYLSPTTGRLDPLAFPVEGREQPWDLPADLAVNHGEAYVAACEAGFGLIQVPRYHVSRQLVAGTLVELLPDYRLPPLPMTILYPHHRHLTPRLRVFIDWLVALFAT